MRQDTDAIDRPDVDKLVSKDPDPMMSGEIDGSPSLERYRRIQADRAELKLGKEKDDSMNRADVHEGMNRVAKILRRAGEQLERKHGAGARGLLDEALDEAEREIEAHFAEK